MLFSASDIHINWLWTNVRSQRENGSWYDGTMGYGWFGVIFIILIVILVIVAVIFLLPRLRQNYKIDGVETPSDKSNALEILKERYALREIDKTEFEEKKKDLEES